MGIQRLLQKPRWSLQFQLHHSDTHPLAVVQLFLAHDWEVVNGVGVTESEETGNQVAEFGETGTDLKEELCCRSCDVPGRVNI